MGIFQVNFDLLVPLDVDTPLVSDILHIFLHTIPPGLQASQASSLNVNIVIYAYKTPIHVQHFQPLQPALLNHQTD